MTAIIFLAASSLFFRIAIKEKKGKKFFPFLLTGVMFITFLEEISYGQRIFGVETPPWETNFHNIRFFEDAPDLFVLCYFIVIPLMLKKNRFRTFFCNLGYLRPPLSFIVFVVVIMISALLVDDFLRIDEVDCAVEFLVSIFFVGIAIGEQPGQRKEEAGNLQGSNATPYLVE